MDFQPKSIGEQIDCLAQLTGAPGSFVDQVRELFTRKGISLEEDSTPYLRALEEAFIREESIRAGAGAARAALAEPVGRGYARQVERLRQAQSRRRARRQELPGRAMLVTRQQHEEIPLVPGPEQLQ